MLHGYQYDTTLYGYNIVPLHCFWHVMIYFGICVICDTNTTTQGHNPFGSFGICVIVPVGLNQVYVNYLPKYRSIRVQKYVGSPDVDPRALIKSVSGNGIYKPLTIHLPIQCETKPKCFLCFFSK